MAQVVPAPDAGGEPTGQFEIAARQGIVSSRGFLSPYYLFRVLPRRHSDFDRAGVMFLAAEVKRLHHLAHRRLRNGSSPSEVWITWHRPLLSALGFEPERLTDPLHTPAGLVSVQCLHRGLDGEPLVLIDLHPLGLSLSDDRYHPQDGESAQPIERAFEAALNHHPTARWGLLGNGVELRLYRKGGQVAGQYLAIDLPAVSRTAIPGTWSSCRPPSRSATSSPRRRSTSPTGSRPRSSCSRTWTSA